MALRFGGFYWRENVSLKSANENENLRTEALQTDRPEHFVSGPPVVRDPSLPPQCAGLKGGSSRHARAVRERRHRPVIRVPSAHGLFHGNKKD